MKKILLSSILFLFYIFQVSYSFALNHNEVDKFYYKIDGKISKYDIDSQYYIYSGLQEKMSKIINENQDHENIILINYLSEKINNKYNLLSLFIEKGKKKNSDKVEKCFTYDCIAQKVSQGLSVEGNIPNQKAFLLPTVHSANKISVNFYNSTIKYKTIFVSNDISEKEAINILQKDTEKQLSKKELDQSLMLSIDSLNRIMGHGLECGFDLSKKQDFINVLQNLEEGKLGNVNLKFAECNDIKDLTVLKISNPYKEKILQEEKEVAKFLKEKYANELDLIDIVFTNFKQEYYVGENVDGEIELMNLPNDFVALISNSEGDFYEYNGKDKLSVYEDGGYAYDKQYYNNEGKKKIQVNIYTKDVFSKKRILGFGKDEIESNSLKTYEISFDIIDSSNINIVNGVILNKSYVDLGNDLFMNENKIYHLNKEGTFKELKGLKKGEYKVFNIGRNIFVYGKNNSYIKRYVNYDELNFVSNYDTFNYLYGDYFYDKDSIYVIDDFRLYVTQLRKGNIVELKDVCKDSFLIIDNYLYKSGGSMGDSCDAIIEKYKEFNLINI